MSPERKLERRLVKYCKEHGIYCRKFVSPGAAGVPDRIMIGPKGVVFLELKSPGQRPTRLQMYEIDQIMLVGGRAFWASDWHGAKAAADACIMDTSADDGVVFLPSVRTKREAKRTARSLL
jgi:hypothetical protein